MSDVGEGDLAHVLRSMLLGIGHVHSRGVVHRDVKPHNFFLGGECGQIVKLGDFDMAGAVPNGLMFDIVGTAPYMSPEMVKQEGYDERTDIWSLGVTIYLMLYGDFPYIPAQPTDESMMEAISIGVRPRFLAAPGTSRNHPSARATSCVRSLLRYSGTRRPSVVRMLKHPFVKSQVLEWLPPSKANTLTVGESIAMASTKLEQFEHRNIVAEHDLDVVIQDLHDKCSKASSTPTSGHGTPTSATSGDSSKRFRIPSLVRLRGLEENDSNSTMDSPIHHPRGRLCGLFTSMPRLPVLGVTKSYN